MFISERKSAWGYASDMRTSFIIFRTFQQRDRLLSITVETWKLLIHSDKNIAEYILAQMEGRWKTSIILPIPQLLD